MARQVMAPSGTSGRHVFALIRLFEVRSAAIRVLASQAFRRPGDHCWDGTYTRLVYGEKLSDHHAALCYSASATPCCESYNSSY